jgi:hypothetical protein
MRRSEHWSDAYDRVAHGSPYLVAAGAAAAAGVLIAVLGQPIPIFAVGVASAVCLIAIATSTLPALSFLAVAVLTLLVPDMFENAGLRPAWILMVGASVVPLMLYLRRGGQPLWTDVSVALLAIGATIPALVSSDVVVVVAVAIQFVGVYLAARIGAPDARLVRWTMASIGSVHALVALADAFPLTTGLVPFAPVVGGIQIDSSRSTGLLNNPNAFGLLEATIIAFLLWSGPTRRLAPAMVLCGIGLLLSGSREAVFGLLLAVTLLVARAPRPMALTLGSLVLVLAVFAALVPGAAERFDPRGFGSDSSLLERFEFWANALELIGRSPIYGYGLELPDVVVDQAYLTWLLTGGLIAAAFWAGGIALLAVSVRPWPAVIVIVSAGMLASVFSGSTLAVMLLLAGALPRQLALKRPRAMRSLTVRPTRSSP